MYLIGKVLYSQIHSLLPREASIVTVVENRTFDNYNEAIEYCRKLRIGGDYTFVPVEVDERMFPQFVCKEANMEEEGRNRRVCKGKKKTRNTL